jgi:uncharacterized membrane protein
VSGAQRPGAERQERSDVSFYDEVLRELVLALGGALFIANAFALVRRRNDSEHADARSSAGSKREGYADSADLRQAPVARTVTYMLIGLIVAAWALASIIAH